MKFSIHGIVGVEVEKEYRWLESLILFSGAAEQNDILFAACQRFIKIRYVNEINESIFRRISQGIGIYENAIIDIKYGVSILWENEKTILIQTTTECNEWLIICLQIMLLLEHHSLVHGIAVCKNEQALLIPSWGGVGKTACLGKLICEERWKLMGDDMFIINKKGEVFSFLKDCVIYPFHRNIFPKLFKQGQGPAAPLYLNELLGQVFARVKPWLRNFHHCLAWARQHNPQSKRISPFSIFPRNCLPGKALIRQVIWLERTLDNEASFSGIGLDRICSKTASVTLMEILSDRTNAVLAMCGCGLLDYNLIFAETYKVIYEAFSQAHAGQLDIPLAVKIDKFADVLIHNLHSTAINFSDPENADDLIGSLAGS